MITDIDMFENTYYRINATYVDRCIAPDSMLDIYDGKGDDATSSDDENSHFRDTQDIVAL